MAGRTCCEDCQYYDFDEALDSYVCQQDLDEDEMVRFLSASVAACPFYRPGDDYATARRQ